MFPRRKVKSAFAGADPVQQTVHGIVIQLIVHRPADPGAGDPTAAAQHAQSLRDAILRMTHRRSEIPHADTGYPMHGQ